MIIILLKKYNTNILLLQIFSYLKVECYFYYTKQNSVTDRSRLQIKQMSYLCFLALILLVFKLNTLIYNTIFN